MVERLLLKAAPSGRPVEPPPARPGEFSGLADRPALIVLEAALEGAPGDQLGLLAALEAVGPAVLRGWVVVPDDLDAGTRVEVEEAASALRVLGTRGRLRVEVLARGAFLEPRAGPLARVAYSGAGFLVARDLLRLVGLLAEHVQPRRGGGSTVWLAGWGVPGERGSWRRRLPDRPGLVVEAGRVGARAEWGPCERGHGKRRGALARGGFVDLARTAYALDAERTGVLEAHLRTFGLDDAPLPRRVRHDADGVRAVMAGALRLHEVAVHLDEVAGTLFTDDDERAAGRRRVDLARTASPASIGALVPARLGILPPRERLGAGWTPEAEAAFEGSTYGGLNLGEPSLFGLAFPTLAADRHSAFAADAIAVGVPDAFVAAALDVVEDDPAELVAACRRVAEDPAAAEDPATLRRWGLAVAEVRAVGRLRLPVRRDVAGRPDGDLALARVDARGRVLPWRAADLLAAAVLDAQAPLEGEVERVLRLVPRGRQAGLRPALPLLPGLVVTPDGYLGEIARHRQLVAKATGDRRLAALERLLLVSLAFGHFGRRDLHVRRSGRRRTVEERPGPFYAAPLAGAVTACARLRQAVQRRQVHDLGGLIAYSAVDSLLIPACPGGGSLERRDGAPVPLLPDEKLRSLLAAAPEPFGPGVPAWGEVRVPGGRQLWGLVWGELRHALFTLDADGCPELVDAGAAGLGGTFASPPGLADYSTPAVERLVRWGVALGRDPGAEPDELPWGADFPALRPRQVLDAASLRRLPEGLGARLGTHLLVGQLDVLVGDRRQPIAVDPGGELEGWRGLDWRDARTGAPLAVVGDVEDAVRTGAVCLERLADRAHRFGRSIAPAPDLVEVGEVVLRGNASPIFDAAERGEDPRGGVVRYGRLCDRPGCSAVVQGARARFCSRRCADAARKARTRVRAERPVAICDGCGAALPAGSRAGRRWCGDRCRKRTSRGGGARGS